MAVAVGIIGAGTSATVFHAPFISSHPSFRLEKFLRSTANRPVVGYETVPVTDSIASFLPGIDLAVVTTPTHTHFSLAKACLEAGKHVRGRQQNSSCASQAAALDYHWPKHPFCQLDYSVGSDAS
jgi:predicted dehydrogenase